MSDINSLSPDFRDFLLSRNLVTDTVKDNGLFGRLNGIGKVRDIETLPNAIQGTDNIEDSGLLYRDTSLMTNQFRGEDTDTSSANIVYKPIDDFRFQGTYDANDSSLIQDNQDYLENNLLKNRYQDEEGRYLINLIYSPEGQEGEPYLTANGKYNTGGPPSTTALDIAGSILTGRGVGFTTDGPEPNFDVRGTLAGRALSTVGVIDDSPLGNIGAQQLSAHLGYNLAFNLQQDTIGRVNTNVVSLLKGNDIIVPNFSITVPKNELVKAVDYGAKVLGFEVPVSLLEGDSSIFASENPVTNILRAQNMVLNTGKGQVLALIDNLNENKYRYQIDDDRTKKGANQRDIGTNAQLYAYNNGEGGIDDLLNGGEKFEPHISRSNIGVSNDNGGFSGNTFLGDVLLSINGFELLADDGADETSRGVSPFTSNDVGFSWGGAPSGTKDNTDNNMARLAITESVYNNLFETNKNSILYKTKKLFDSGKMRTLVSGKGVDVGFIEKGDIGNINGNKAGGMMSKGSAVLADGGRFPASEPADIFCRTWTNFDRYNQVANLQKNRGLDRLGQSNSNFSVLDDNGFVKISPYASDFDKAGKYMGDTPKKYMFSIENLAWEGYTSSLPECEIGSGDLITGVKGRIMWFPPYEMGFTDNSTVQWESNTFIGRGEPLYTYNNTERKGTLQWKIIIDHNTYQNAMFRDNATNDEMISFNAGCLEADDKVLKSLTKDELVQAEVIAQQDPIEMNQPVEPIIPDPFFVYFPNDSASIISTYEDGIVEPDGTTVGEGIVGLKPYTYVNRTDFGLNIQEWFYDDVAYSGILDSNIIIGLNKFLTEDCKSCKVKVTGSVSQQINTGSTSNVNTAKQEELAQKRADVIATQIFKNQVLVNDKNKDKRVITAIEVTDVQDPKQENQDAFDYKVQRSSMVEFIYDTDLAIENGELKVPEKERQEDRVLSESIRGRMVTECDYFEKLEQTDKFTYDSLKSKMKHFHPAFHSITPEGFNSRLTFLKQCTRQGPTKNPNGNPDNLAFGRPPICILRIGDFYNTKIAIDNVSFSFEPLVWDLNPEGIGVQPMICNVDMTFSFIGGSSLAGPINRLQNALGFNYFANTELYDDRADKIKVDKDPNKAAVLVPGVLNKVELTSEELKGDEGDTTGRGGTVVPTDQEKLSEDEVDGKEEGSEVAEEISDDELLSNLNMIVYSESDGRVTARFTGSLSGLSQDYNVKLVYKHADITPTDVLTGTINGNSNNFEFTSTSSLADDFSTLTPDGNVILLDFEAEISGGGVKSKIFLTTNASPIDCTSLNIKKGYIITDNQLAELNDAITNDNC